MQDKEKRMLEKKSCQEVLASQITRRQGAEKLEVTLRSVKRYLRRFRESGPEGLYDHRRSNYEKITEKDERQVVLVKLQGGHRSALD